MEDHLGKVEKRKPTNGTAVTIDGELVKQIQTLLPKEETDPRLQSEDEKRFDEKGFRVYRERGGEIAITERMEGAQTHPLTLPQKWSIVERLSFDQDTGQGIYFRGHYGFEAFQRTEAEEAASAQDIQRKADQLVKAAIKFLNQAPK